jgi:hypothetical protein
MRAYMRTPSGARCTSMPADASGWTVRRWHRGSVSTARTPFELAKRHVRPQDQQGAPRVGNAGMVSLNDPLMDLVAKKLVAPDEAYSKSVDKAGFEMLLKRAGIDPKTLAHAGA